MRGQRVFTAHPRSVNVRRFSRPRARFRACRATSRAKIHALRAVTENNNMRIDAYTHFVPRKFYESVLNAGDHRDIGKRMKGVPAIYDLDVRLKVVDSFPDYAQILSYPMPPLEAMTVQQAFATLGRSTVPLIAAAIRRYRVPQQSRGQGTGRCRKPPRRARTSTCFHGGRRRSRRHPKCARCSCPRF